MMIPGWARGITWCKKQEKRKNRFFTHISFLPQFAVVFVSLLTRCFGVKWVSAGIYLQLQVTLNLFLSSSSSSSSSILRLLPKANSYDFFFLFTENRYWRITELPNCFFLSFFLSSTHHRFVSLFSCVCW